VKTHHGSALYSGVKKPVAKASALGDQLVMFPHAILILFDSSIRRLLVATLEQFIDLSLDRGGLPCVLYDNELVNHSTSQSSADHQDATLHGTVNEDAMRCR